MRASARRPAAAALAAVVALLAPAPAAAVNAEHAQWVGSGLSDCTEGGPIGWTCRYEVHSALCAEAVVVGPAAGDCTLRMVANVHVAPLLNASGDLVGCASVPFSVETSGLVYFDSSVPAFDNVAIDTPFVISVVDYFGDGKPGALAFAAHESGGEQQNTTIVVTGTMGAACARGLWVYSRYAAGAVDAYESDVFR